MTTKITKIIDGFHEFSEYPYEDTIKFLEEYLEVDPENSQAIFELGKALFFIKDYDRSIEYLEKSDNPNSDAYIGLDYYNKGDWPNSIRHFKRFLKSSENETVLSYLMLSYANEKEFKNAVRCGEKLLDINPKNTSVKIRLIDYHFENEEYEKALYYINSLDLKKLKFKKALTLFKLRRYEECIEVLKFMKTTESYELIAKSYKMLDKPSKAARYLRKSYELDGNIETLFKLVDLLFENSSYNMVTYVLRDILETNPYNEDALEKISMAYMELQIFDEAKSYCEKLLGVNENNATAYLVLANTYYFSFDYEKAMEYVEKGLEIDPKYVDLLVLKAWLYWPTDFELFKRFMDKVIRLEPNNTENYITLIRNCAWKEDNVDNAEKYYEKLLFYNPAFAENLDEVIGDILKSKEKYPSYCFCW